MGIEFAESFDAYPLGNTISNPTLFDLLDSKWTSHFLELDVVSNGRTGKGLTIPFGSFIFKTLAHRAFWSTVFAFRVNSGNGGSTLYGIQNNGTPLFYVNYNFDHTLAVYASGNLIAVTDKAIHQSKFNSLGVDVTFSGSSPITITVSLWLNGEKLINAASASSGVNASSLLSGTATGNVHVFVSGTASTGDTTFDDIVISNGEADSSGGSLNQSFIGDVQLQVIVPNGDVLINKWSSTAVTHWDQVNEIPADTTTYVEDGTATDVEVWAWQDIGAFSGKIIGLQYNLYAKKTDEGSKSLKHNVGATGTTYTGPEFFVNDDYVTYHMPLDADPATGVRFTVAGFNATDFGVQVQS